MEEKKKIVFSHSKLECCLNNPMDYYLNYKIGIKPKEVKTAFQVGSAMHWGFEHNTEDLTEWFKENGTLKQSIGGSEEQEQAEAMCHGYFANYDKIMDEVLDDGSGKRVRFVEGDHEFHELEIHAKLPSYSIDGKEYDFMGIIDLLFLTEKGFIVMDYKSSSQIPDFEKYLDQIYRYIFLLETNFPSIPIYKIGIINLVKSKIKKLRTENDSEFKHRWAEQYEPYPNRLINVHMFDRSKIEQKAIDDYIDNFRKEVDLAYSIDQNSLYYINYKNAIAPYRSDYYDIYFNTPNAFVMYSIRDTILDPDTNKLIKRRDCVPSDLLVVDKKNVLYSYETFENERNTHLSDTPQAFFEYLLTKYIVNEELFKRYIVTYDFLHQKK